MAFFVPVYQLMTEKWISYSVCLPAAGMYNGSSVMNGGNNGYYWSSSPNADNANNAQYLNFNSSNANVNNDNRNYVYSLRVVLAEHLS